MFLYSYLLFNEYDRKKDFNNFLSLVKYNRPNKNRKKPKKEINKKMALSDYG